MLNGVRETQRWDYEAYIAIPFDGKRHEIVSGEHFVNPAPSLYHQQVSRRLQFDLYQSIELDGHGVVINAPVDVQLSSNTIVQPDLVVISKSNSYIMTPTKVKGVPDLLIEILSPSNSNYDLVVKRKSYLEHRVARYWIVDPEEHIVHVLNLRENEYVASVEADQLVLDLPPTIRVDLLPPTIRVDLKKVW